MACSRLVFTVLLLSVSCYATNVPVFLWGNLAKTPTEANPLETTSTDEFRGILEEVLVKEPFTVVFIDETLSVEDFSRKNTDGETSFTFLHANLKDSLYIPSVDSPLRALKELSETAIVDHVKLTENGLSAEIGSGTAQFLFINLKDAKEGESRVELLRRHNDFMEDMFDKLKKQKKNVIAVYTANYPSWVIPKPSESHLRVRRQTNETSTPGNDYKLDGLRFYVKNILIIDGNNTIALTGNLDSKTELNDILKTMNITMTFGEYTFITNFRLKAGYWFFDSITLNPAANEEILRPNMEVFALQDWSYRCAQSVFFKSTNVSRGLKFEDLQIQPYFKTTNVSMVFGETFDCVGYFSAPIWTGLFVTFLLLAITFYGIMMMMDIRTMDRFDDPKGKTITINASE